jgi:hypothetical protein
MASRLPVTLSDALRARIDRERGPLSRAAFVALLVVEALQARDARAKEAPRG